MRATSALLVALLIGGCGNGRDTTIHETSNADAPRRPYAVGSCAHDYCNAGGALSASCDPCVASVCKHDRYCCNNGWDAQCVNEVATYCTPAQQCSGGGGGGCAHSICTTGSALGASCD